LIESLRQEYDQLGKRDAHIIIFTTGSTGEPKPALICHEKYHHQQRGILA
jgi:acyl-coenzyme A synthetase/AMP-(fatty) acid ligase